MSLSMCVLNMATKERIVLKEDGDLLLRVS